MENYLSLGIQKSLPFQVERREVDTIVFVPVEETKKIQKDESQKAKDKEVNLSSGLELSGFQQIYTCIVYCEMTS